MTLLKNKNSIRSFFKHGFVVFFVLLLILGGSFGFGLHLFTPNSLALTASFTETFDSTTYKDATNTTGFWNTREGTASIHNSGTYGWSWNKPTPQGRKLHDVAWASATVAVAVGEGGIVMRTTNGGATWTKSIPFGAVTRYTGVDFFDANVGYIVGWPSMVLKTVDGGVNWASCTNTGFNITYPNDVFFTHAATGYVVGESGKMYKTVDSCDNWASLVTGTVLQLNAVASQKTAWENNVVAVGGASSGQSVAIMSNDAGVNFDNITGVATDPLYDVVLTDHAVSYVAGSEGVFISTPNKGPLALVAGDAGLLGTPLAIAGFLNDNNTAIAVDSNGLVSKTVDGGLNWATAQTFSADGFSLDIFGIAFQDVNTALVVGGSGMIAKSITGGTTWQDVSVHVFAGELNSLVCPTTQVCYAVGMGVLKTSDAGVTWTKNPSAAADYDVSFFNESIGLKAGSVQPELTTDGATTWQAKTTGLGVGDTFRAVKMIDANNAFVAGNDSFSAPVVYKTTNCATDCSWNAEVTGLTGGINDIAFLSANTGYVVTNAGEVGKYVNGVWSSQTISANPLSSIYCYDANNCWAATSNSGATIYGTADGAVWTPYVLASPDAIYGIYGFDSKNVVVTGLNYLQSTKDGGATWTQMVVDTDYPLGMRAAAMITPTSLLAVGHDYNTDQMGTILNISSSYNPNSVLQSLTVDSVTETITAATLTATQLLSGGTASYEMTANGGLNWEAVTSGVEHVFTNTGSDLRWRVTLGMGPLSPSVATVAIDYTYAGRRSPLPIDPPEVYLCSDGLDNDGDGLIDYPNDPGCSGLTDDNESDTPACSDGIDNDNDGKIDYPADFGCTGLTDDNEADNPQCSDGIDNDNNGKIDFPDDPGCVSGWDDEELAPALAINLPDGIVTNKKEPRIGGTTMAPNTSVDIYIDNVKYKTVVSDAMNNFEWKLTSVLPDGTYEVYAKVGATESAKLSFTVDTLPPDAPIIQPVVINSQNLVDNKVATGILLSGTTTADAKYLMVYVDNEIVKILKPTTESWSFNLEPELSIGTHFLVVKAVDQAGNFATVVPEQSFSVTDIVFYQCNNKIDDDADGFVDLADVGCASATDNNETNDELLLQNTISLVGGAVTNNNLPQVSGKTLVGVAQVDIYVDGVKIDSVVSSVDKTFTWKMPTALIDGMHELAIKVGDVMSAPQMIFVDTELPMVSSLDPIKIPSQKIVDGAIITELDMAGNLGAGAKYVLLYVDDVLFDRFVPTGSTWQYKIYQSFAVGQHSVSVRSMDEAGNISELQAAQTFVVEKVAIMQCNNGLDDDQDGVIDLADPGCENKEDDTENTDTFVRANEKVDVNITTISLLLNMATGASIGFTKDGLPHSLEILSTNVREQLFDILISSDPIRLRMRVGETKQVDIDGDGILDLEVKLLKILDNKQAVITVRKINIKIVVPEPREPKVLIVPIDVVLGGGGEGGVEINLGGNGGGAAAQAARAQAQANQILDVLGGGGGGGGGLPDQLDPALLNNPEIINKLKEIGEKNEWDKTEEERQLEILFETEKLVQNETVQAATELAANVVANVFGVDAKQTKQNIENGVRKTVKTTKQVKKATLDNPTAEKLNDDAKTPAMATVTATSAASVATVGVTGSTGANAVTYLQFVLSQGLMLFVRKRKEKWGTVFNSITKQPIDLAVVRIYNAVTNKLVGTKVTDKQGRYNFILKPGKYYLQVEKKDFRFPSKLLNEVKNDGKFENVYYGNEFEINEEDAVVRSIALDPHKKVVAEKSLVRLYLVRKGQLVLTFIGPVVAVTSFVINPQWWVGGTVVAQLGLYIIFKKLGIGDKPKSWGAVKEIETRSNVARAIVRVFDTKFNKLLETQVTDGKGRYAFLVGNQEYYMTAEKAGYFQRRTNPYNLAGESSGYLIDDLYLKKQKLDEKAILAIEEGAPVTIRTDMGRQTEKVVDGVQKTVRRDEEKFVGELPEVDLKEMHEDYYALDSVR